VRWRAQRAEKEKAEGSRRQQTAASQIAGESRQWKAVNAAHDGGWRRGASHRRQADAEPAAARTERQGCARDAAPPPQRLMGGRRPHKAFARGS
jgi:hypothetical protein